MSIRELLDSGRRLSDLTNDELWELYRADLQHPFDGAINSELIRRLTYGPEMCGELPLAQR